MGVCRAGLGQFRERCFANAKFDGARIEPLASRGTSRCLSAVPDGGNRVLSQAALDRLHDDRIVAAYDGSAGLDTGYAMGWWVDRNSGRIHDPGAYGAVSWLDLEDGYGAYLVIEADAGTGLELAAQLHDLVETAVTSFD